MNEAVQGKTPMREEELYALLDRAMTEERLQVSEALIQKTLQRVKEENSTTVIPFGKKTGKRNRIMQYACVAAAAVFVLAVGVRTFNGGNFTAEDAQKGRNFAASEAETDSAQMPYGLLTDAVGGGTTDAGIHYYYSTSESDSASDSNVLSEAPKEVTTEEFPGTEARGGKNVMAGTTVTISENLVGFLADARMAVKTGEAEYWEFAAAEQDWEKELVYALRAGAVVQSELPESGSYSYALNGEDGSQWNIQYNEPLDAVVCIKTEQGVLWGLLGESCEFFLE